MTAGHGIVHSERTPDDERTSGQSMHGLQTWVALPKSHEGIAPDFAHHPADTLPEFEHRGARMKVLAGEAFGHASPVEFPWPILYVAFEADDGASLIIPGDLAAERALYLVTGKGSIEGQELHEGQMLVLAEGADVAIRLEPGTKGVLCGGATMDGPRKIEWNFVASDAALIEQAKQDWTHAAGNGGSDRFPLVPGDATEWIPLP